MIFPLKPHNLILVMRIYQTNHIWGKGTKCLTSTAEYSSGHEKARKTEEMPQIS